MPPFKPMKRRDYERWIREYGWYLTKGGWDWQLNSENHANLCTIKITHPGAEIPAGDVKKTEKLLKREGLV